MTPYQSKVNLHLKQFGQRTNTSLHLENGVCALYDHNHLDIATIEVPPHSDSAIFYCTLHQLSSELPPQALYQLLQLNFEISAMQGCWVAINPQDQLMLCHVLPLEHTDAKDFENALLGFIEQVKDTRIFAAALLQRTIAS